MKTTKMLKVLKEHGHMTVMLTDTTIGLCDIHDNVYDTLIIDNGLIIYDANEEAIDIYNWLGYSYDDERNAWY